MSKLYKCPPTDLRGFRDDRQEVMYAVSYTYNGGITIGDEWYDGYEVPPPLINPGYKLVGIGVGLQLNAQPPLATAVLRRINE
jgi:hypothetical protein